MTVIDFFTLCPKKQPQKKLLSFGAFPFPLPSSVSAASGRILMNHATSIFSILFKIKYKVTISLIYSNVNKHTGKFP